MQIMKHEIVLNWYWTVTSMALQKRNLNAKCPINKGGNPGVKFRQIYIGLNICCQHGDL